jgi:hypothetical protein
MMNGEVLTPDETDIIKAEFLISLFAYNFYVRSQVLCTYDGSVKCAIYITATLTLLTW